MVIIVNGKKTDIIDGMSIKALLDSKSIAVDTVVVELNKEIVPADALADTMLNDGDHLEVLRFVGGG